MTKKDKIIHIKDIRLFINAGASIPVCYGTAKLLDLEKSYLPMSTDPDKATCKRCTSMYKKRYDNPWL